MIIWAFGATETANLGLQLLYELRLSLLSILVVLKSSAIGAVLLVQSTTQIGVLLEQRPAGAQFVDGTLKAADVGAVIQSQG
jgi:hypothetical protein